MPTITTSRHNLFCNTLCAFFVLMPAIATADIYRCTDERGNIIISNNEQTKNCKKVATEPANTVPAPKGGGGKASVTTTDPKFPRVDGDAQKAKDSDRKFILNQELENEQKALEQAKKELADQEAIRLGDERNYQKVLDRLQPYKDQVAVHERNLEALKKEIGNAR